METLPESQWSTQVDAWLAEQGHEARQALVLLAGAPERTERTQVLAERRARMRNNALERVRVGLESQPAVWEKAIAVGLDLHGLRAQGWATLSMIPWPIAWPACGSQRAWIVRIGPKP